MAWFKAQRGFNNYNVQFKVFGGHLTKEKKVPSVFLGHFCY